MARRSFRSPPSGAGSPLLDSTVGGAQSAGWSHFREEVLERFDDVEERLLAVARQAQSADDKVGRASAGLAAVEELRSASIGDTRGIAVSLTGVGSRLQHVETLVRQLSKDLHSNAAVAHHHHTVTAPRSVKTLEKRIVQRVSTTDRVEREEVVDGVRDLLANFRAEIVTSVRALESKIARCNKGNQDTAGSVQGHTAAMAGLEQRLRELERNHDGLRTSFVPIQDGSFASDTKSAVADLRQECRREFAELRDSVARDIHHEVGLVEKATCSESNARLQEFSNVVTSKLQRTLDKMSTMQSELANKIYARVEAVEAKQRLLVEGFESFGERLGRVQEALEDFHAEHTAANVTTSERLEKLEPSLASAIREVDQLRSDANAVRDTHTASIGTLDGIVSRLEQEHGTLRSSWETALKEQRSSERSARAKLGDELNGRLNTMGEELFALQHDLDARIRRIVESTHTALEQMAVTGAELPGQVQLVQNDVATMKETLTLHESAIERWRVDAGALAELKDWLRDLERRAASKSEVTQGMSTIAAQVNSVRDTVQNSDAVLTQRIEAERSARDYETTSIRSLVQRLHHTTTGRSPPLATP